MAINKIQISSELIVWAINESQIPELQIKEKFKKIDSWINGSDQPTFKQLKDLSNYLKVPFGYLFLKKPPNTDKLKKEFRTINNKINNNLSKDLKDVLIDMEFKKNWLSEYRASQGWEPINFNVNISLTSKPIDIIDSLHALLKLSDNWFLKFTKSEDCFNHLRNQIEKTGVIVMMNGIVGQNTHRILNLKEFRAFALMDLYAPLIFINRQDSYTGMIFSLIHEFIHLLLDNDDIILNESYEEKNNIERTINSYVAEFLMPTHYLKTVWKKDYDAIKQIGDISRTLNVSQSALVIKLCELSLVNDKIVNQIFAITNTNVMHKKSKGGNYYSTLSSRISNSFSQAVINQTESGSLRYTDAYRLLGINGKTYQQFKEYKEIHRLTNE